MREVICTAIMTYSLISARLDTALAILAGISCKDPTPKNAMLSGITGIDLYFILYSRFGGTKIHVSCDSYGFTEETNFLIYRDITPGQNSNFHCLPANWRLRYELAGQLMTYINRNQRVHALLLQIIGANF